jgi:hypothetical protein
MPLIATPAQVLEAVRDRFPSPAMIAVSPEAAEGLADASERLLGAGLLRKIDGGLYALTPAGAEALARGGA